MSTSTPRQASDPLAPSAPVTDVVPSGRLSDRAADAVWRRLCDGLSDDWLAEARDLRSDGDDFETSLDVWSVALIAALKDPDRKETASTVLTRLRRMADGLDCCPDDDH
jgi:hypothetical protein